MKLVTPKAAAKHELLFQQTSGWGLSNLGNTTKVWPNSKQSQVWIFSTPKAAAKRELLLNKPASKAHVMLNFSFRFEKFTNVNDIILVSINCAT